MSQQVANRFPLHPWYHYLYLLPVTLYYAKKKVVDPFFVFFCEFEFFHFTLLKKKKTFLGVFFAMQIYKNVNSFG